MSEEKEVNFLFYPQSYLVNYVAYSTPRDGPPEPDKPLGFLDPTIKISRLGIQNYVKLAKIKGSYLPEALISKIITSGQDPIMMDKLFLNMDNHKLSALTPELRLYKVSDETGEVTPFYFPITADYNFKSDDASGLLDLSNSSYTSNAAVIESFSVTYTGKNPFQASRGFLEAKLTIKVDNISLLFDLPSGFEDAYAPLADLFIIRTADGSKTPGSNKKSSGNALENGKSCRIAATLGYSGFQTDVFDSDDMEIIRKNHQTMSLFYSNHDLNLETDGSATINVSYTGFLEAVKGESQYDLISSIASKSRLQKAKTGGEKKRPKKSLSDFMAGSSKVEKEEKEKAKSTKKEEVVLPTVDDIMSAFKQIVDSLYTSGKIHVIPTSDVLIRRLQSVARATSGDMDPELKEAIDENIKISEELNRVTLEVNPARSTWTKSDISSFTVEDAKKIGFNPWEFVSENYVCYFAFGDLLDAYYKKIGTDLEKVQKRVDSDKALSDEHKAKINTRISSLKLDLKKMNVLMSDVFYVKKQEASNRPEERKINISDIPISIDTFYTIVFEEITKVRKSFYDMNDFITSLAPKLLTRGFNEFPGADHINSVTFTTTTYSSSELPPESISNGVLSIEDVPSPIKMTAQSSVKNKEEYIIIHQKASRYTRPFGKGDTEEDSQNGIFHLRANQNCGLVKSISFSRIQSPAREAYMIVRNGKIYDELRYAHNASVKMVGNNMFYPSCCVYINPDTLGFGDPRGDSSAARMLGFGGYYVVGNVTTTFASGELNTDLQLYFNSFPETESQAKIAVDKVKSIKKLAK